MILDNDIATNLTHISRPFSTAVMDRAIFSGDFPKTGDPLSTLLFPDQE
jgi:hypothetical protein